MRLLLTSVALLALLWGMFYLKTRGEALLQSSGMFEQPQKKEAPILRKATLVKPVDE